MDLISQRKAHVTNEMGVTVKCQRGIVAFYDVLCDYIVVIFQFFNSAACKLYVTQKRGLNYAVHAAFECFNFK